MALLVALVIVRLSVGVSFFMISMRMLVMGSRRVMGHFDFRLGSREELVWTSSGAFHGSSCGSCDCFSMMSKRMLVMGSRRVMGHFDFRLGFRRRAGGASLDLLQVLSMALLVALVIVRLSWSVLLHDEQASARDGVQKRDGSLRLQARIPTKSWMSYLDLLQVLSMALLVALVIVRLSVGVSFSMISMRMLVMGSRRVMITSTSGSDPDEELDELVSTFFRCFPWLFLWLL
ncbi:hypothetical protein L596_027832 [Steinernema carpocapsae]|uniref:Uncharacterized protein n=1 Tax=Steinernema carpocapsae TaxID=34508 RepID=A0A4U5LWP2_STECR|nr:hypothetical protein L596_027832 [Steinernema carpocapsae]